MTRCPRHAILGPLAAVAFVLALASVALAVGPEAEGSQAPLAWIRFVDGEETHADVPYFWPGKVDLRLQIDVKPGPGHVLELFWGSKNDAREAVATINGKELPLIVTEAESPVFLTSPVLPQTVCHCVAEAVPIAAPRHCLPSGKQRHTVVRKAG